MKKKKLLIMLFAGSLVLPNLVYGIFREQFDTANHEQRELAEFPQLSLKELGKFPEQFDAFYKDHVPFKNEFVKLKNELDTRLFRNVKIGDVVLGEDNWLFYLPSVEGEDAMADYQKTNEYSEEKSQEILGRLCKVQKWLTKQGVEQFRYYVAPSKESLYGTYMPEEIEIQGEGNSRMESFAAYMEEQDEVSFTYLKDDLSKYAEKYQLFKKYDTHMNNLGGYVMSEKITLDLTGSCLPLEEATIKRGKSPCTGDLSRMIGKESELDDDREFGLQHFHDGVKYEVEEELAENGEEIFKSFRSNSENKRTILVIGDSFRLCMEKFLPYRYEQAVFVRIDDFSKEILETYQPEDVIVVTVERDQRYLENIDTYLGAE